MSVATARDALSMLADLINSAVRVHGHGLKLVQASLAGEPTAEHEQAIAAEQDAASRRLAAWQQQRSAAGEGNWARR